VSPLATTTTSTTKKTTPSASSTDTSMQRPVNPGFVSHTEFASNDPAATKAWASKVLGWKFGESMPTPTGPYEMWRHESPLSGGGIRKVNPGEPAGTIPYVEVQDIQATWKAALKAGAKEMMAPNEIPGGNGWLAICQAPGGPAVGFWSSGAK